MIEHTNAPDCPRCQAILDVGERIHDEVRTLLSQYASQLSSTELMDTLMTIVAVIHGFSLEPGSYAPGTDELVEVFRVKSRQAYDKAHMIPPPMQRRHLDVSLTDPRNQHRRETDTIALSRASYGGIVSKLIHVVLLTVSLFALSACGTLPTAPSVPAPVIVSDPIPSDVIRVSHLPDRSTCRSLVKGGCDALN